MLYPEMKGRNLAIITHAGGPAVMLTDVLAQGNMDVPHLEGPHVDQLLKSLYPGSSASNPIDLLATGNAEQVGLSIDYCESFFKEIDGIVVIFGTPGLTPVFDVYEVLHQKMLSCSKPIFPVLPSVKTAHKEVEEFLSHGHINFPDEVLFGEALTRVYNRTLPSESLPDLTGINLAAIKELIHSSGDGYLAPEKTGQFLDAAGISRVAEGVATDETSLTRLARDLGFPLVMKVVGPLHKSEVRGVIPGIDKEDELLRNFRELIRIEGARGVLLQPMLNGIELFVGAKYEPKFGHVMLCGIGGIYVEVMKDLASGLAPLSYAEAQSMIHSLKGYHMLQGIRGQEGIKHRILCKHPRQALKCFKAYHRNRSNWT